MQKIAVAQFKAECLRKINQVHSTGEPLIVTKHGKPLVKIIPILDETKTSYYGCLKDTIEIVGDITLSPD